MTERDFELSDAETLTYTMSEAVADEHGDDSQEYLIRFIDELFQLEPGFRSHFLDQLIGELKEEVVRRKDSRHLRAVVALIEEIEADWGQEA